MRTSDHAGYSTDLVPCIHSDKEMFGGRSMESNGGTPNRIAGEDLQPLTILRFFISFWVVFTHQFESWKWIQLPEFEFLRRVIQRGDCGVKIFFVLSGFILTHVYAKQERFSSRSFFAARFARIYPMYITALLLAIPGLWLFQIPAELAQHEGLTGWAMIGVKSLFVLLLMQSWIPDFAPFWNEVSWSLSTESFFYGLFPSILRKLKAISVKGILGILLVCLFLEIVRWTQFKSAALPNTRIFWMFTPLVRMPDFLTGIGIGLLWIRGFRLPPATILLASGLIFLGCVLPSEIIVFKALLIHLGCASLILSLAFPCRTSGFWVRTGVLLGQSSFAIYLIHQPLGFLYFAASAKVLGTQLPFWSYPPVLIACSIALYLRVESPARIFLRRRLK
ncbi:MAG TPA: acyltransferase [Fibrobacteria bacterium]|nr:acyltransferase [Fibrobacteria bacterium]